MDHSYHCGLGLIAYVWLFVGGVTLLVLAARALWPHCYTYGRLLSERCWAGATRRRRPAVTGREGTPFWRWPTAAAYLVAVWAAGRALVEAGADLHAPATGVPFALFGLALGLGLTLLEREG